MGIYKCPLLFNNKPTNTFIMSIRPRSNETDTNANVPEPGDKRFVYTRTFTLPNAHLIPREELITKIEDYVCDRCGVQVIVRGENGRPVFASDIPLECPKNYNFKIDNNGIVQRKEWKHANASKVFEKKVEEAVHVGFPDKQ